MTTLDPGIMFGPGEVITDDHAPTAAPTTAAEPAKHAMRAAFTEAFGTDGKIVRWRRFGLTVLFILTLAVLFGAARAIFTLWRWVLCGEGAKYAKATHDDPIAGGDHWAKMKAAQRAAREERIEGLRDAALVFVVVGLPSILLGIVFAPRVMLCLAAVCWVALGWYGWTWKHKPRDLVSTLTPGGETPAITHAAMVRAFGKLGISDLNAALKEDEDKAIRWIGPGISHDRVGRGILVRCELPPGVLGSDVLKKQEKLASALSLKAGRLWVSIDPEENPAFVEVWIPDKSLNKMPQPPWPYLRAASKADYFEEFQFGTDQMGRPVMGILDESGSLAAGQSGFGKSSACAVVLYYSALDPTVEHWICDLAGKGDWSDARLFASRFVEGQEDEDAEAALQMLRDLRNEVRRRSEILRKLPVEVRGPKVKVTRKTAAVPGLHPLHLFIDEAQELFGHPDKNLRQEARKLAIDCSKLGRAVGVHMQFATQQPTDDSFPVPLRNNIRLRACFRVIAEGTSKLILGDDAAGAGICATQFTTKDQGVSWVVGPSSHEAQPTVVRWHFLDSEDRAKLAARARALREQRGMLRGLAAGIEPEPTPDIEVRDILADTEAVTVGREKVWTENLLTLLGEKWPGRYGGWTAEQLAAEFKPYGIEPKNVRDVPNDAAGAVPAPRKGYDLAPIRTLLYERDQDDADDLDAQVLPLHRALKVASN